MSLCLGGVLQPRKKSTFRRILRLAFRTKGAFYVTEEPVGLVQTTLDIRKFCMLQFEKSLH